MSDTTPGDVFAAATDAFVNGDPQGWLALAHPDIVLEFPFAPAGLPRRVEGKTAVAEYLHATPGQVHFDEVRVLHTHQALDPETAVVEWTATGHVKATGEPYEMSYAVVITLVDGLMAVYREYWNPLIVQQLAEQP